MGRRDSCPLWSKADVTPIEWDAHYHPKSDIRQRVLDVRFVPIATKTHCSKRLPYSITSSARPAMIRSVQKGKPAMDQKTFTILAGVVFAVVALLHVLRIWMGWPAAIGGWAVPMWLSWVAVVVAGGLSYLGLSLAMRR